MIWRTIAEEQALIIENLVSLCHKLMDELSQYKSIEDEELRLSKIIKEDKNDIKRNN